MDYKKMVKYKKKEHVFEVFKENIDGFYIV